MELKKGHHTAKGWYTYGDDEGTAHFDFKLRDCKRSKRSVSRSSGPATRRAPAWDVPQPGDADRP